MTGAEAQPPSLAVIRQRYPDFIERLPPLQRFLQPNAPVLSYTQWEAWLALYHGKVLIIATPRGDAPRDEPYRLIEAQRAAQQAHLERLATVERYPEIRFANADRLATEILGSALLDILIRAGAVNRPANLPYVSLGELFKGREVSLDDLSRRLGPIPATGTAAVVAIVINGLGGVGKTRLALEHAWRHTNEYAALLFVNANSPETLNRDLAALCGPKVLNLPAQGETDEDRQRQAVLDWLQQHPGWLLILDNIDSQEAAQAAEALLPDLRGGHVLLTSRLTGWSGGVGPLPLDVLSPEAAMDFLLARTGAKRRQQADDPAAADTLAETLGYLALALEQAGAYIAQRRLSFAQYLKAWQDRRDRVLAWFDPRLMQYPTSVAITWQTSFDQLGEAAQQLLQRLAWLGPETIPESIMEVPVPGLEATETDPFDALIELEGYSLVARAADTPSFSIHRLVQEVTRRQPGDEPENTYLHEALRWIDSAFVGETGDVRDWPVLDPLSPHAQAVALHADAAGISDPTARLMNETGLLFLTKALYAEAEPLMRRALATFVRSLGMEHPNTGIVGDNYIRLLQAKGRTEDEIRGELASLLEEI